MQLKVVVHAQQECVLHSDTLTVSTEAPQSYVMVAHGRVDGSPCLVTYGKMGH